MEIKNGGTPIRQKLQVLSYLSPPQKKRISGSLRTSFFLLIAIEKLIGV